MSKGEDIITYAKSIADKVQYVFGANNPQSMAFDCSSFVQYVYKQNGITIGRDTLTQVSGGKEIAKVNLQKGDLVFFQNTYRSGVSHVGIYIGGGQFIHNSCEKDDVIISKLSDKFWSDHWYGARRYLDDDNSLGNGYNEITGEWEVKDGSEPQNDDSWIEKKINEFMSKYIKSFTTGLFMVVLVILALILVYMAVGVDLKESVTKAAVNEIVG